MKEKLPVINLTEEDLMTKRIQIDELKLKVDTLNISKIQFEKMIELDMPLRQARNELAKVNGDLRITEKNIKILEKMVREKKQTLNQPVN